MTYTFDGIVKQIFTAVEFASGFKKREILLTTVGEKFEQDVKFEFIYEGVKKLNEFKVGDKVKLAFGLKSNEHNGKYYTNLVGVEIAYLNDDGTIRRRSLDSYKTDVGVSDGDLLF